MNNRAETVTLKKPVPLFGIRLLGQMVAAFMLFGAIILCFTIIGILPGIGLAAMAVALNAASKGISIFGCPYCKKKNEAVFPAENVKCLKCKSLILVNWENDEEMSKKRDAA